MAPDAQLKSGKVPSPEEWIAQCDTFTTRKGHHLAYRTRGAGTPILMLHGFPTWSYDWAAVATNLEADHEVTTLDFLGYGASDKPNPYDYTATEGADCVEDLLKHIKCTSVHLVVHDFGGLVGQELLDRHLHGKLPFEILRFTMLNCGIVYEAYRPTMLQRLLIAPVVGKFVAGQVTAKKAKTGLEGVWGSRTKLSNKEFNDLWHGVALKDGHKIWHLLVRYNKERAQSHQRWWDAMVEYEGPLHLIWGVDDPVSGAHILESATKGLPKAKVTKLEGVGHFPQMEAAGKVMSAIRDE